MRNENEFDEKKDSEARACQGRSSFQKNRAQKPEVKGYGAQVTVLLEQRTNPKGAGFAGGLVGLLHRPLFQVRGVCSRGLAQDSQLMPGAAGMCPPIFARGA